MDTPPSAPSAAPDGGIVVIIRDDGHGIDPIIVAGPGHQGLANMRGRATAIGARLTIEGAAEGGTIVRLDLPPRDDAHGSPA